MKRCSSCVPRMPQYAYACIVRHLDRPKLQLARLVSTWTRAGMTSNAQWHGYHRGKVLSAAGCAHSFSAESSHLEVAPAILRGLRLPRFSRGALSALTCCCQQAQHGRPIASKCSRASQSHRFCGHRRQSFRDERLRPTAQDRLHTSGPRHRSVTSFSNAPMRSFRLTSSRLA